jgi:hypothetical protein
MALWRCNMRLSFTLGAFAALPTVWYNSFNFR